MLAAMALCCHGIVVWWVWWSAGADMAVWGMGRDHAESLGGERSCCAVHWFDQQVVRAATALFAGSNQGCGA